MVTNGGVTPPLFAYGSAMDFSNSTSSPDSLTLLASDGSTVIDSVSYGASVASGWPVISGPPESLRPTILDVSMNDTSPRRGAQVAPYSGAVTSVRVLGGKYKLLRLLGAGGMGQVFEALNQNTDRRVAIKTLHTQWKGDPSVVQRFLREARAATKICHPNVVDVLDLDVDRATGVPYIVQEFLAGESLEAHLDARADKRLPVDEVLRILTPVMGALVAGAPGSASSTATSSPPTSCSPSTARVPPPRRSSTSASRNSWSPTPRTSARPPPERSSEPPATCPPSRPPAWMTSTRAPTSGPSAWCSMSSSRARSPTRPRTTTSSSPRSSTKSPPSNGSATRPSPATSPPSSSAPSRRTATPASPPCRAILDATLACDLSSTITLPRLSAPPTPAMPPAPAAPRRAPTLAGWSAEPDTSAAPTKTTIVALSALAAALVFTAGFLMFRPTPVTVLASPTPRVAPPTPPPRRPPSPLSRPAPVVPSPVAARPSSLARPSLCVVRRLLRRRRPRRSHPRTTPNDFDRGYE
ncbi:MAG: protein kinase [Deltaproteobacteria bacterium]|nr:protein kinase [Deltaproteobacteria bacterium]